MIDIGFLYRRSRIGARSIATHLRHLNIHSLLFLV